MMHLEKDVKATAENIRRWSKTLKIPSGSFVNEDLEDAAEMLEEYANYLSSFTNGDL